MGFFNNIARMTAGALGTNQLSSQGGRLNPFSVVQKAMSATGIGMIRNQTRAQNSLLGRALNKPSQSTQQQLVNSGYSGGMGGAPTPPQTAQAIIQQQQPIMNTNTIPQTPISPKAFSNQDTIQSVFGQANPDTFTRVVGAPNPQIASQSLAPTTDNTNLGTQNDANTAAIKADQIEKPITPLSTI